MGRRGKKWGWSKRKGGSVEVLNGDIIIRMPVYLCIPPS